MARKNCSPCAQSLRSSAPPRLSERLQPRCIKNRGEPSNEQSIDPRTPPDHGPGQESGFLPAHPRVPLARSGRQVDRRLDPHGPARAPNCRQKRTTRHRATRQQVKRRQRRRRCRSLQPIQVLSKPSLTNSVVKNAWGDRKPRDRIQPTTKSPSPGAKSDKERNSLARPTHHDAKPAPHARQLSSVRQTDYDFCRQKSLRHRVRQATELMLAPTHLQARLEARRPPPPPR
ncbi:hypothetical protein I41_07580 [Lacipirellula limnantheis]|uniref:Uncharacterized protein n=1 Tax=Lacipirellula limnantheis TaxID=2528024 RepID=A0A517TT94_9BACT|nr:hypothetical protein I41_07580 [Lacipirellula limnantheis]